jgi:hypothetical protein
MRMWVPVGVLAFVGACSDAEVGPTGLPGDTELRLSQVGSGNPQDVDARILVRAEDAPLLETLHGAFWAVRGERQTFRIRYDVPGEVENPSPDFFRLDLHQESLLTRPDGNLLADGDSILITVDIDPVRLLVELGPSGLTFSPEDPAELRLWYARADRDYNGDGVEDDQDVALESSFLGLFTRDDPSSDWQPLSSDRDTVRKRFTAEIEHFTGYTISW